MLVLFLFYQFFLFLFLVDVCMYLLFVNHVSFTLLKFVATVFLKCLLFLFLGDQWLSATSGLFSPALHVPVTVALNPLTCKFQCQAF